MDNFLNELVLSSQTQTIAVQESTEGKQDALLQLDQLKITRQGVLQNLEEKMAIVFGLNNRKSQLQLASQEKQNQLNISK